MNQSRTPPPLIGIRVDGSYSIGLGHIYRSFGLGEALRKSGCIPEFLTTKNSIVHKMFDKKGFRVKWLEAGLDELLKCKILNKWARENQPAAIIVDHWDKTFPFWNYLEKQKETIFVAIDIPKEGLSKFNIAFQSIREGFRNSESLENGCSVYRGPKYLMISPQHVGFLKGWQYSGKLEKILLTFGGTDVANFALKTLDRFEKMKGKYKLTLITGPGSQNYETIKAKAKASRHSIEVLRKVIDMPARMCKSHLAITTAGLGTLSELALTTTPAIVLAAVKHQVENAIKFSAVGGILNCAKKVGVIDKFFDDQLTTLTHKPRQLAEMSNRWKGLVDGYGVERMITIIMERIKYGL